MNTRRKILFKAVKDLTIAMLLVYLILIGVIAAGTHI